MAWTSFGQPGSAISDRRPDPPAANRIGPTALILAASIWISTSSVSDAAGWKAQVSDGVGGRTAAVEGTADDSGTTGIAIACAASGKPPAQITIAFPADELEASPGESARITLSGQDLQAEVIRDDSSGAMLVGEVGAVADLVKKLAAFEASIDVRIALGPHPVSFSIPPDGLAHAMSEIETACNL